MRVLAATPPQCCLDLAWRPDGVSLRAVEVGSPGHIEEAELNGVDVLLLAGFHPGPDLLRDLTGLLGRFPAQRVAVVAADAADEFVSGLRRLGIVEIWPELSRRRLADLLGQRGPFEEAIAVGRAAFSRRRLRRLLPSPLPP